jgi:hypothetical protein
MKRIFIPTRSGSDWQRLLAKPKLHWKKGASAMTAAAAWEAAAGQLPPEIAALLTSSAQPALVDLKLLAALPEWEVALKGGETTSNTDVLALCRNALGLCVVAVEAKVLEDFGPLLREKRASPSQNQESRLAYLHELLKVERFDDSVRYQLLHRTASAVLMAEEFHARTAVMLVHAFATPTERQGDFKSFCLAMAATEIAPGVYKVPTFEQPALYLAWCAGNEKYREIQLESAL